MLLRSLPHEPKREEDKNRTKNNKTLLQRSGIIPPKSTTSISISPSVKTSRKFSLPNNTFPIQIPISPSIAVIVIAISSHLSHQPTNQTQPTKPNQPNPTNQPTNQPKTQPIYLSIYLYPSLPFLHSRPPSYLAS